MQERFIQCENMLINAKIVSSNVKGVIQCKRFAIQPNKRDIRQENQAEKNFHRENNDLTY